MSSQALAPLGNAERVLGHRDAYIAICDTGPTFVEAGLGRPLLLGVVDENQHLPTFDRVHLIVWSALSN